MDNSLFKFENLEVWQISLDVNDLVYEMVKHFPEEEKYNLTSQMRRAVTSISLNIAEGSAGATDKEQINFLKYSKRSCLEIVAGAKISLRRKYLEENSTLMINLFESAHKLYAKISAFMKYLQSRI